MEKDVLQKENVECLETLYFEIMNPQNPFFNKEIAPSPPSLSLNQPSLLTTVESITTYSAYENQHT
ncbi:MAG: hypothetical protein HZA03_02000 [Nitrospinae bacterium]|nr:hypothetical protein [Nitrospinota bacterium]